MILSTFPSDYTFMASYSGSEALSKTIKSYLGIRHTGFLIRKVFSKDSTSIYLNQKARHVTFPTLFRVSRVNMLDYFLHKC